MKIKEVKDRMSLSSKWKGFKLRQQYCFEFIGYSILVDSSGEVYSICISSEDGIIKERFTSLDLASEFIEENLDIDI